MTITKELLKSGIYCFINIKNNKRYIGSSVNVYQRLLKHRSLLRKNKHQNRRLQNSWNKHSEEHFDFYILEFCDKDNLEIREQFYIDTIKPEYNITLIVERNILSKESRILQSETRKRKIKSGEIKLSCEKKIFQYDLEGNFIEEHESIKKACIKNNIHQSTICRYLNGTYKKGGNYLWSLEYFEKLSPYIRNIKESKALFKIVQVIDFDSKELVHEFESVKECAKYFNKHSPSISYAIRVKQRFNKKYMIILKSA